MNPRYSISPSTRGTKKPRLTLLRHPNNAETTRLMKPPHPYGQPSAVRPRPPPVVGSQISCSRTPTATAPPPPIPRYAQQHQTLPRQRTPIRKHPQGKYSKQIINASYTDLLCYVEC